MVIKTPQPKTAFETLFQLNYETFGEEIPQHQRNSSGKLIDKYHERNNYLIGLVEDNVVGMVCYMTNRPFCLDNKTLKLD
jgi:hypothetical protein